MSEFLTDDLKKELEKHLKTAVEVCIAAAFINLQGVELLRSYIERTLGGKDFKIQFLLDKDFHQHPAARDVIIKELCKIQGAEVRVFHDDEKRMHMKVYILSSEHSTSVIVGSHNPTGAGLQRNIEASLLTSNEQGVAEAKQYFKTYWERAIEAVPNEEAYYRDPLFTAGQRVEHRQTHVIGAILAENFRMEKTEWYYPVLWNNGTGESDWVPESILREPIVVVLEPVPVDGLFGNKAEENQYIESLLLKKLKTPVRDGLFSYMASRTDIVDYQFKPVLKMLASDSYRVLIADEVGLGKTIEAGIIYTELKARMKDMKRVLVICPTNLKTKWRDELESRFDEYFDLLDRKSFLAAVQDPHSECFGIVSYELLGQSSMIDELKLREAMWDFIILDEAHHLRNENLRNRAVIQIAKQTKAIVMLSATPVNLGVNDLAHLLQILLPMDYRDLDFTEFMHRIYPNRFLFEAVAQLENGPQEVLKILSEMENICKYAPRVTDQPSYQKVREILETTTSLSEGEKAFIEEEITQLNTLAQVISRTRKEDVGAVAYRDVLNYEVVFTPFEKEWYEGITQVARLLAKSSKQAGLSTMMPQRQAASCLPAAMDYLRDIASRSVGIEEEDWAEEETDDTQQPQRFSKNKEALAECRGVLASYDAQSNNTPDTKYDKLLEFLQTRALTDEGELDKVIVFTSFRRTLAYLKRRLEADFGEGTVVEIHGDIKMLERDERRRRFQDKNGPALLICTEVGSEGLDMQFANKLVNYDLPWNPMRVEQRIGRIDRHGQKAEKLLILNFTTSDTIEDNVMSRLLERVKVFRDSLGELSDILGKTVQKLTTDILDPELTSAQRQEKIRKYERAVEKKLIAEKQLREKRHEMIGQDKNFTTELRNIHQNRRYVTPGELRKVVELFQGRMSEDVTMVNEGDGVYRLQLSTRAQERILQHLNGIESISQRKKKRYQERIQKADDFHFTFDREVAVADKSLDFMTLHHPILASMLNELVMTEPVYGNFVKYVATEENQTTILFTYYCEFERTHLPKDIYVYHIAVQMGIVPIITTGDKLYEEIITGEYDPDFLPPRLSKECVSQANEAATKELKRLVTETASTLQREAVALANGQIDTLYATVQKEIKLLSERAKLATDNRVREYQSEIIRKREEMKEKLEQLTREAIEVRLTTRFAGLAVCRWAKEEEVH